MSIKNQGERTEVTEYVYIFREGVVDLRAGSLLVWAEN